METNIRQANAKVSVEGLLSDMDLKEEMKDGVNVISGKLTLKTSDVNFVQFPINIREKTKAGTDNRAYPGIKTVMNEYKSIASVGEANADIVRTTGELNMYHSQNGNDIVSYKSNFFNRIANPADAKYHATFDVEMFISQIIPEMTNEGEETGRILVKGWVPMYENGIEPLALVADTEVADTVESIFEAGQTVDFWGDIINNRIVKTTEIPAAIGKPKVETKISYKNELVITGASDPYEEGVTPEKPYDPEVIKACIQERTTRIESQKEQASRNNTKSTTRPSGASRGRTLDLGF